MLSLMCGVRERRRQEEGGRGGERWEETGTVESTHQDREVSEISYIASSSKLDGSCSNEITFTLY